MKLEVVTERPAFTLNGSAETVEVSFTDLRAAETGAMWETGTPYNDGHNLDEEIAEVVYKTDDGVAVLFRRWGTRDDLPLGGWEAAPVLKWFEFQ